LGADRFAGGAAELGRGALALLFALIGGRFRAVGAFFLATTRGRVAGFARRTAALEVLRAPAFAFDAVFLAAFATDFLAALRAIFRDEAVFFAVARVRPLLRPFAADFRPEARTAFRLAIAWFPPCLARAPGRGGGQP